MLRKARSKNVLLRAILRFLFGGAGSPVPAADAEATADAQKRLVSAIRDLRAVVENGSPEQIVAAVDLFKAKAAADDLEPRELAGEIASAEHVLTVLAYADRLNRGEGVQAMAVMPDGEPTYFRANVSRETARDDDYGQLDIADKAIFYDGAKRLTIVWGKVLTIGIDRESLIVHPTRGGTPHTFYLKSEREARLAHAVASTVFKQHTATATSVMRRKRSARPAVTPSDERSLTALDIGSATGNCNFNIVGESQYQGRLRNISTSGRSFTALLMPEPTNAFDPNAIRVVAEGGDTIGYLSREDAVHYAPVFELLAQHNRVGTCQARLTGGVGEKRSFGVLLSVREVDELLTFIRDTVEPGAAVDENVKPF
jgi:hypothetical protein